ncbi:unnamed protein product, partial [Closterium sp. NIES-53]
EGGSGGGGDCEGKGGGLGGGEARRTFGGGRGGGNSEAGEEVSGGGGGGNECGGGGGGAAASGGEESKGTAGKGGREEVKNGSKCGGALSRYPYSDGLPVWARRVELRHSLVEGFKLLERVIDVVGGQARQTRAPHGRDFADAARDRRRGSRGRAGKRRGRGRGRGAVVAVAGRWRGVRRKGERVVRVARGGRRGVRGGRIWRVSAGNFRGRLGRFARRKIDNFPAVVGKELCDTHEQVDSLSIPNKLLLDFPLLVRAGGFFSSPCVNFLAPDVPYDALLLPPAAIQNAG